MAAGVRDRMIDGTVTLLAQRGVDGTSFSTVLELTGAPRGSLYHHFPGGKEELVAAAVDASAARALGVLDRVAGRPAVDVTAAVLDFWRAILRGSRLRAGCAVAAVTVAADSDAMRAHAADAFRTWRARLAEVLVAGGVPDDESDAVAAVVLAACEGGVLLARAEQSMDPFEAMSAQLLGLVGRACDGAGEGLA